MSPPDEGTSDTEQGQIWGRHVTRGLLGGLNGALGRALPEKRLFLKSDDTTRFVRLGPGTQLTALTGAAAILGWLTFASALVIMDAVGSGSVREQAERERAAYEDRLNELSAQRDARTEAARRAQDRFATALHQVSAMQTALLASDERRKELETGIEVIQATLRRTMAERDAAVAEAEMLVAEMDEATASVRGMPDRLAELEDTLDILAGALTRTAAERDTLAGLAAENEAHVEDLILEAQLTAEKNARIFTQLEEAVSVSLEPMETMFRAVGLDPDALVEQIRRGYSEEDSLGRITISTKGDLSDPEAARANEILDRLDGMNLYRMAAEKAPFAAPLRDSYRFTSGFGPRWGRMHEGSDFAGPHGTPIHATADGVVTYAGRQSGYGNLVTIRHAFGIETAYAHNSKLHVKVGQSVSRGDHIADMGNTGRSTGTHLHYEVRVDGQPVDPMRYIKAARDVF